MREIKFRAWDTELNKFVSVASFVFPRMFSAEDPKRNYILFNSEDRFILQQFTYLKDKTGKDIYEGDIISYQNRVGRIEFFACSFKSSWNDQTDNDLGYMMINDIEVIGNIFENPELLK